MIKDLPKIKRILPALLKLYGVKRAGVFGSFARQENTAYSDLDLVVEFSGRKSLFDLVDLKLALEERLHGRVDVVTYRSLHPLLRKRILKEEQPIL